MTIGQSKCLKMYPLAVVELERRLAQLRALYSTLTVAGEVVRPVSNSGWELFEKCIADTLAGHDPVSQKQVDEFFAHCGE